MRKYIFKCKNSCDADACKIVITSESSPDYPTICPYNGKEREFKLKIKEVNDNCNESLCKLPKFERGR